MHSPSLPMPLRAVLLWLAEARHQLNARRVTAQQRRTQRAQARALRGAERELAEMSLHGLRDIGAPETLLERRQRDNERLGQQQHAAMHLRG